MPVKYKTMVGKRHVSSLLIFLLACVIISGCGVVQSSPTIKKIALLAPFEGRYRDIGYNALYAVRLAMTDRGTENIHLLAVDDGGSIESALDRIHALNIDPDVKFIIALGEFASHPDVQQANDKPMIVIGFWGHIRADEDSLFASHPEIAEQITTLEPITELDLGNPVIGSDLMILSQLPDLYDDLSNISIISSGTLPDEDFYQRYIESDLYVPEPNLLATLTYDIANLVISALNTDTTIGDMTYTGITGNIKFTDGYWQNAPIRYYEYHEDELILPD